MSAPSFFSWSTSQRTLRALAIVLIVVPATAEGDDAFKESVTSNLQAAAAKLISLAEATDADKFSWRPTPEVRSIGQVYMHIVGSNFQLPALLGAAAPEGIDIPDSGPYALGTQRAQWEADFVDKDEVTDMLRRSFDYAAQAIPAIEGLDEEVTPFGFKASKRDYLLILMAHAHEHLGQSIAYARSAGMVPPWSRPAERPTVDSSAVFEGAWGHGETLAVDRFGNLETSFVGEDLARLGVQVGDQLVLRAGDEVVEALLGESFFDVQMGEWVAFVSQSGRLMVGRSYGNAASTLDLALGDKVSIQAAGSKP